MDIEQTNWNESDNSNSTAAPDGAPEGMAASGVNDVLRATMGAIKRWLNRSNPKVTAGSSTAYTLTYSVAPTSLVDAMSHVVQFNAVNGANPTLNVNGLGAKPLTFYCGGSWSTGTNTMPPFMLGVDQVVPVTYNAASGTYRCIGLPLILRQTVSAAAQLDFTNIPTNVNNLEITTDLTMATNNSSLFMRFFNSAGTIDTSASYYYQNFFMSTSPATAQSAALGSTAIVLGSGISNNASYGWSGKILIPNIQGIKITQCEFNANWRDQAGTAFQGIKGFGARELSGNITGIRIFNNNTISGPATVILS
jgi:hypothetical protein